MSVLAAILLTLPCALAAPAAGEPAVPRDSPTSSVVVEAAIVADSDPPTVAFRVTNGGDADVVRGGLMFGTNHLDCLAPSGRAGVAQVMADDFGLGKREVIAPGESHTWELPLADLPGWASDTDPGYYRFYLTFGKVRSNELVIVRKAAPPARGPVRQNEGKPGADAKTPKAALRGLLRAADRGEFAGARYLHAAEESPAERAVQGAFIQRFMAAARFRDQAEAKFGRGAVDDWSLEATAGNLAAVEQGSVTYPPYFETAALKAFGRRYHFVRDWSVWRVSASTYVRDGKPQMDEFDRRTKALFQTADDISLGRIKSAREAKRKLLERLDPEPST